MADSPIVDATNSPLTNDQAGALDPVLKDMTGDQLTWLSGFALGLKQGRALAESTALASGGTPQQAAPAPAKEKPKLRVLYASQTGNAEAVAHSAGEAAVQAGFDVAVSDVGDYKAKNLKNEHQVLLVASTHGEGDPPDTAAEFHETLFSKKAPKLQGLRYSVLSLGDTSYEHFCQIGKDFDRRLAELGGTAVAERVDCDVDYEDAANAWIARAVAQLAELAGAGAEAEPAPAPATAAPSQTPQLYSRKNPYPATLLTNQPLTGRGSAKETRHIELSIEDSGLVFEPGDAIGVFPTNDPAVVDELLRVTGLDPAVEVPGPGGEGSADLRTALKHYYEITALTPPFLKAWAARAGFAELTRLVESADKAELRAWMYGREIVDVAEQFPIADLGPAEFVGMLRKLPPRSYSIASSYTANPDEVHLTVAAVRYASHGRQRQGVASTYLADRVGEDDTVPIYVEHNKNFKLPQDPETPIIMVGPGTGVAPFRAFLEERAAQGIYGKSWLFFGEQRFRSDFLYQVEWQKWLRDGVLARLDAAFSRDGAEKEYVQHKLRQNAAELWAWIEAGAHLYVCGDAERMAPDVHQALLDIAQEQGGLDPEAASSYMKQLQSQKRYQRDVY